MSAIYIQIVTLLETTRQQRLNVVMNHAWCEVVPVVPLCYEVGPSPLLFPKRIFLETVYFKIGLKMSRKKS